MRQNIVNKQKIPENLEACNNTSSPSSATIGCVSWQITKLSGQKYLMTPPQPPYEYATGLDNVYTRYSWQSALLRHTIPCKVYCRVAHNTQ